VEFLAFGKIVSLQSDTAAGAKSEPREYFPLPPSLPSTRVRLRPFVLVGRDAISTFQRARRNSWLIGTAKPNMYFAAALITFAAKTPTVNGKRPTNSTKNIYEGRALSFLCRLRLSASLLPLVFCFSSFFSFLQRCKPANLGPFACCVSEKTARLGYEAPFVPSVNCRD